MIVLFMIVLFMIVVLIIFFMVGEREVVVLLFVFVEHAAGLLKVLNVLLY